MERNLLSISALAITILFIANTAFAQKISVKALETSSVIYDSIYYYYAEDGDTLQLSNRDVDLMYDDTLLLSYINQTREGNAWVNSYKRTYTYDADGRPLTHAYSPWNGSTFGDYSLIRWKYDENGNNTLYLQQIMNDSSWSTVESHERLFGENDELLEEVTVGYGSTLKSIYSYRNDMLKDTMFVYSMVDSAWVKDYIIVYKYDDNGNGVEEAVMNWTDDDLSPAVLTTRDFNETDMLVREVTGYYFDTVLRYDTSDTLWYDSQDRLLGQLRKIWNEDSWENSHIVEFTYNSDGHVTTSQSRLWNFSDWITDYINTITYREGNVESSKWIQYEYLSDGIDYIDSVWYYFGITTDMPKQPGSFVVQTFPNPTTGLVTFTANSQILALHVYSSSGRLVKVGQLQGTNSKQAQLDLSGYHPGIYVIDLITSAGRSAVKVLRK